MPRPSRPSFELLETFLVVIEEGGDASKAASRLAINQPSMSKRLSQLQGAGASIRSPWLERSGKTWGPTEEGRRVFPAVAEVVRRYRALDTFATGPQRDSSFHFACGQESATGFVLEALKRLLRERPEAHPRISTLRGRARIEGVASGSLDLATVSHSEADIRAIARRSLHLEHLRDDPLVLIASPSGRGKWLKSLKNLPDGPVAADSLTHFPLILPEPDAGIRAQIDLDLELAGVSDNLQIAMEVGGWSTIRSFVLAGLGAGIVTRSSCSDPSRGLFVRSLDPTVFRPIPLQLIARKAPAGHLGLDLSADAERFRRFLIDCASEVDQART